MSLFIIKLNIALTIFLTAFLAGAKPLAKTTETDSQSQLTQIAQAFACGIFLGAGLLHMLGDSAHAFYELGYHYPWAQLITGSIFLVFLWLEHLGREIFHHKGGSKASFALLATLMLAIHSFLEGAAIGLTVEVSLMLTIFLAIMAHKSLASFSLAIQLQHSLLSKKIKWLCFLLFCCMTPLGIFFGQAVTGTQHESSVLIPILNAAAGGTFLYLGTLHGLDYAVMVKSCCKLRAFAFLVLGFILMGLVAVYT